ncbi:MAG TPA: hypothetical protein VEH76_03435 [Methylocystis sp.]|nr:hypothetical protein [Methylocystis sp.]
MTVIDMTGFSVGWILRYIAEGLRDSNALPQLNETFAAAEAGVPYIDLRKLNRGERQILSRTMKTMVDDLKRAGPSSLGHPAFNPGLLDKLEALERLELENV